MKLISFAAFAAGLAASAVAAPESYTVDPRHTWPIFEVSHFGYSVQRGRFNKTSGKIRLDRANESGTVELVIDSASIDMGFEKWDEHMKADEFFNVAKFPAMNFKSARLQFSGGNVVGADGELTLLGVTKPVKLAVSGFRCAPNPLAKKYACGADISTTIKRSDFGMTKFLPNIGDVIRIKVPVEAFRD